MIVIEIIVSLLAALVLVPVAMVFAQVMLALFPAAASRVLERRPSLAVLVPAHNEAEGMAATLRSILPQLGRDDRLLVVADNCTDDTALIAARTGAEVIVRTDAARRGKGYALDFGMRYLASSPPEVLIMVDADCHAEDGAIEDLARACWDTQLPTQALYLMHAPLHAPLQLRVAEFAWLMKNWIRPLGNWRLGLPCQLMGTGMAFPWALISNASLAHAEIVEDMKLGIDLAIAGHPPMFCPEARVTSNFPAAASAISSQRTRWEHGHIGMILHEVPHLLGRAVGCGNLSLLAFVLDLAVPPLTLLTLLVSLLFVLCLSIFLAGLSAVPLALSAAALGLLAMALLVAWLGWGRKVIPFDALLAVPFYVLEKIPVYLSFWTRRQKEWVRTDRK